MHLGLGAPQRPAHPASTALADLQDSDRLVVVRVIKTLTFTDAELVTLGASEMTTNAAQAEAID